MAPTAKHRVLVVDDNRDAATSMSEVLSAAGFAVETCYDGPSAMAAADRDPPDACVLDIAMPGMDGYDLARRLRERFPDRPPLLATMTAFGDYAHLDRAVDAGFDLQFTKPAAPADVIDELRRNLADGRPFAEAHHEPAESEEGRSALHRLLARLTGLWSRPGA
jgi:CheY-like chemotaxis protein